MEELVNLTKLYIKAFSNKDLDFIHSIVDEGFILQDPVVSRITGKSEALLVIKKIFADYDVINFNVKNIFVSNKTSVIEFILHLDNKVIEGVDIIEWNDNKMIELRAYF